MKKQTLALLLSFGLAASVSINSYATDLSDDKIKLDSDGRLEYNINPEDSNSTDIIISAKDLTTLRSSVIKLESSYKELLNEHLQSVGIGFSDTTAVRNGAKSANPTVIPFSEYLKGLDLGTIASAQESDVLDGQWFLGAGSKWMQGNVENMPDFTVTPEAGPYTGKSTEFDVPNGLYRDGKKVHVDLSKIIGGDAAGGDILSGKSAYVNGEYVAGTIPLRNTQSVTVTTDSDGNANTSYSIDSGYYSVDNAKVNLSLSNLSASASTGDVYHGKTFFKDGKMQTGTMPDVSLSTTSISLSSDTTSGSASIGAGYTSGGTVTASCSGPHESHSEHPALSKTLLSPGDSITIEANKYFTSDQTISANGDKREIGVTISGEFQKVEAYVTKGYGDPDKDSTDTVFKPGGSWKGLSKCGGTEGVKDSSWETYVTFNITPESTAYEVDDNGDCIWTDAPSASCGWTKDDLYKATAVQIYLYSTDKTNFAKALSDEYIGFKLWNSVTLNPVITIIKKPNSYQVTSVYSNVDLDFLTSKGVYSNGVYTESIINAYGLWSASLGDNGVVLEYHAKTETDKRRHTNIKSFTTEAKRDEWFQKTFGTYDGDVYLNEEVYAIFTSSGLGTSTGGKCGGKYLVQRWLWFDDKDHETEIDTYVYSDLPNRLCACQNTFIAQVAFEIPE